VRFDISFRLPEETEGLGMEYKGTIVNNIASLKDGKLRESLECQHGSRKKNDSTTEPTRCKSPWVRVPHKMEGRTGSKRPIITTHTKQKNILFEEIPRTKPKGVVVK